MYIHRIVIRNFRNFDNLDITLFDDDTQRPLDSVLLIGPNGSGKTTLLRLIATLWEDFGRWLHLDDSLNPFLRNGELIAIEIRNFKFNQKQLPLFTEVDKPASIWVYVASSEFYRQKLATLANNPDAMFVGIVSESDNSALKYSNTEYLSGLTKQKRSLEIGMESIDLLPNIVFLGAGTRNIPRPRVIKRIREIAPDPVYRWLVKYEPDTSERERYRPDSDRNILGINEQNIETILGNIKLRNPEQFYQVLANINQFFGGVKEIVDFDNATQLRVYINKNKKFHPLSELSAGEQQCLIMMVMVSRGLMPGGVVLIDEPDLHLHESLQYQLISAIETIVHERDGQLIVASHSHEMWKKFYESQKVRLKLNIGEAIHE